MTELTSQLRLHNSYTSELFLKAAKRIEELESCIVIWEEDLRFAIRGGLMPLREYCESDEVDDIENSLFDKIKEGNRNDS